MYKRQVRKCGAQIIDSRHLADHDPYLPETTGKLDQWIGGLGDRIDQVICTHKDLVKLQTDKLAEKPLAAILIDLKILDGSDQLEQAMRRVLNVARRSPP